MKKLIFIIAILVNVHIAWSQEEAVLTHYYVNPVLINPATAGFAEVHQLRLNLRAQWTGFPGAPNTYSVNYNGPISRTIGVGATLFTENIGALTRYSIAGSYAFRYQKDDLKLAFGFATQFKHFDITESVYNNPLYEEGDLVIEDAVDGVSTFDASVGLFLNYDQYYIGFSSPNLIRSRVDDLVPNDGSFFRHYQIVLGSKHKIENADVILEPSILMRKVRNVPFQADFNIIGKFLNEQLITGLNYRSGVGGSIGILLGTKLSNLSIYYSYDVGFQKFQQFNNGSHEVTLGIDFEAKKKWLLKEE